MPLRHSRPPTALAVLAPLAAALVAGCGGSGHVAAPSRPVPTTAPASISASPAASAASATSAASAATASARPPVTEPGGGQTLLPGRRVVAFYGAAGTPALGVLGTASANALWPRLDAQARVYSTATAPVLPAYELIADVIQAAPGADGDYSAPVSATTIASYVAAARAHDALLILDIQPGRSSFLPLAQRLAPYLADPHVGLALDPEWRLAAGQRPDQQIGKVSAAEVNEVSSWLDSFTTSHHLPQKMLLVHQFVDDEITDKPDLLPRAHLAMVINMDGFGSPADKLAKYHYLAADTTFGIGFKLFYKQDTPLLSPAQVLALRPAPAVVDYQ
jgi:hypothetical protein